MRVFLFLTGLLAAAIAVSVLPAYGGVALPPVLAWLPKIVPPEVLAFPAFMFWIFAILAAVLVGFVFFGHAGVALVLITIVVVVALVEFGFVALPVGLAFMTKAVPWVGAASLAALAAITFLSS
ncbi:hypothetical protein HYW59_00135 [Candidatus Kaiserbacteria bacterium]|nr:hypothetical protein [Candidatus Kaiserbacteria bacterium]